MSDRLGPHPDPVLDLLSRLPEFPTRGDGSEATAAIAGRLDPLERPLHGLRNAPLRTRSERERGDRAAGLAGGFDTGGVGMVRGLSRPIRAFHGASPSHPDGFDRFDLSKATSGTGENWEGHGIYLSRSRRLAEGYRDQLGRYVTLRQPISPDEVDALAPPPPLDPSRGWPIHRGQVFAEGNTYSRPELRIDWEHWRHRRGPALPSLPVDPRYLGDVRLSRLRAYALAAQDARQTTVEPPADSLWRHVDPEGSSADYMRDALRRDPARAMRLGYDEDLAWRHRVLPLAEDLLGRPVSVEPGRVGKVYEVRLNADPDALLDWDAPLSRQSPRVRAGLSAIDPVLGMDPTATGHDLYRSLATRLSLPDRPDIERAINEVTEGERMGEVRASERLRAAGIPGATYLDHDAVLGRGRAPRNFVMYDPDLIEILDRYAAGGEVRHMASGGVVG